MKTSVPVYTNLVITPGNNYQSNIVQVPLTVYNTDNIILGARIQNGAVAPFQGALVEVKYAFSSHDYSGSLSNCPIIFAEEAGRLPLKLNNEPNSIRVFNSDELILKGNYLYVWLNYGVGIGEFNASLTLNLTAVLLNSSAAAIPAAVTIHSTTYSNYMIAKAGSGTVFALIGYNSRPENQFIQIHDSPTLPADGAIPAVTIIAEAGNNFGLDVPVTGMNFQNGITVCNSSTGNIKTIGAADCFFTINVL